MTVDAFWLKTDFLAWSGGFIPCDDDHISKYVEAARPADSDPAEVTKVLTDWMRSEVEVEDREAYAREQARLAALDDASVQRSLAALVRTIERYLTELTEIPCDSMGGADAIRDAMDEAQARLSRLRKVCHKEA